MLERVLRKLFRYTIYHPLVRYRAAGTTIAIKFKGVRSVETCIISSRSIIDVRSASYVRFYIDRVICQSIASCLSCVPSAAPVFAVCGCGAESIRVCWSIIFRNFGFAPCSISAISAGRVYMRRINRYLHSTGLTTEFYSYGSALAVICFLFGLCKLRAADEQGGDDQDEMCTIFHNL